MFICDHSLGWHFSFRAWLILGRADLRRGSAPHARRILRHLRSGVAVLGLVALNALAAERHAALSPEEALKSVQLGPGLRIELVAAEPLVVDPVAFAFDERGRLFVAEDRG